MRCDATAVRDGGLEPIAASSSRLTPDYSGFAPQSLAARRPAGTLVR
ncbi:hypothetical protein LC55x_0641 [Lysobacter capsici]|nr:hypothetical protein LC55x_0641 [Lysobacter capsici]